MLSLQVVFGCIFGLSLVRPNSISFFLASPIYWFKFSLILRGPQVETTGIQSTLWLVFVHTQFRGVDGVPTLPAIMQWTSSRLISLALGVRLQCTSAMYRQSFRLPKPHPTPLSILRRSSYIVARIDSAVGAGAENTQFTFRGYLRRAAEPERKHRPPLARAMM